MPFAGEPLDELVADRERGRDENLLVERMLGADAGELRDQTAGPAAARQASRGSSNGR